MVVDSTQAPQAVREPWVDIDLSDSSGVGRCCPVETSPADVALGTRRETLRARTLSHLKTAWVHLSRISQAMMAWVKGLLGQHAPEKPEKLKTGFYACCMDLLNAHALTALEPMQWRAQYLEVFDGKNELARLINGLHAVSEHATSADFRHEAERLLKCVFDRAIQVMSHQRYSVTRVEVEQSKLADLDYWRNLATSVQSVLVDARVLMNKMFMFGMPFDRGAVEREAVDMSPNNVGLPPFNAFA